MLGAATAIAMIATEPVPEIYACAATMAAGGHTVVLIDTREEHEAAWGALVLPHEGRAAVLMAVCKAAGTA